jgi:hypothetical protein
MAPTSLCHGDLMYLANDSANTPGGMKRGGYALEPFVENSPKRRGNRNEGRDSRQEKSPLHIL